MPCFTCAPWPAQLDFFDLVTYLRAELKVIDDRRYNFQFGTEIGYEIKKGKLGRLLRNCTYTGITPEFWSSCDAVCNQDHWQMWGIPHCGKGQPGQIGHTGHGASPARFRNVTVGVLK